jgi:hypothetical protein
MEVLDPQSRAFRPHRSERALEWAKTKTTTNGEQALLREMLIDEFGSIFEKR